MGLTVKRATYGCRRMGQLHATPDPQPFWGPNARFNTAVPCDLDQPLATVQTDHAHPHASELWCPSAHTYHNTLRHYPCHCHCHCHCQYRDHYRYSDHYRHHGYPYRGLKD